MKHVDNTYHAMSANELYREMKVKMRNVGLRPGRILPELVVTPLRQIIAFVLTWMKFYLRMKYF